MLSLSSHSPDHTCRKAQLFGKAGGRGRRGERAKCGARPASRAVLHVSVPVRACRRAPVRVCRCRCPGCSLGTRPFTGILPTEGPVSWEPGGVGSVPTGWSELLAKGPQLSTLSPSLTQLVIVPTCMYILLGLQVGQRGNIGPRWDWKRMTQVMNTGVPEAEAGV